MRRHPVTAFAATAAIAALLAGCGGGSSSNTGGPLPAPTTFSPSPCPPPAHAVKTKWPHFVPKDMPKPRNATIIANQSTQDGVRVLRFSTPTSLREAVIFVVEKFPKAGYVLGRGDAEPSEADAPFVKGDLRGLVRMTGVATCQTVWLLATVNMQQTSGNTPLLPPHSPSGSPSPLPFG